MRPFYPPLGFLKNPERRRGWLKPNRWLVPLELRGQRRQTCTPAQKKAYADTVMEVLVSNLGSEVVPGEEASVVVNSVGAEDGSVNSSEGVIVITNNPSIISVHSTSFMTDNTPCEGFVSPPLESVSGDASLLAPQNLVDQAPINIVKGPLLYDCNPNEKLSRFGRKGQDCRNYPSHHIIKSNRSTFKMYSTLYKLVEEM